MPAGTGRDAAEDGGTAEQRLTALEEAVGALAAEVRTRRLVVSAGRGAPSVVAEVVRGTAELRLELPAGGDGSRTATVLFAGTDDPLADGGTGLGPGIGLQLWAEGGAVAELDAWPDADGRWHPQLHLDG